MDFDDDGDVNKQNAEARVVSGDVVRNRLEAAVSAPDIHVSALMENKYFRIMFFNSPLFNLYFFL